MNVVVPLFLIAPLLVVPIGVRLLDAIAPGTDPLRQRPLVVIASGGVLAVAFVLPAGALAAVLAVPWLVGSLVMASGIAMGVVRRPATIQSIAGLASAASVGFLVVGATFALTDRLGARPFDFPSSIILLTAVHFHFAGFVLPLAGALAYRSRPAPWLAAAILAVIVGIPVTALGFFGFPAVGWVGSMLTAAGGLGVGVGTLVVAGRLPRPAARALASIAGGSLLLSMPLAALYATGTLVGATWLDIPTMARVHGGLNALGFALPVVVAWTLVSTTAARAPSAVGADATRAAR